eukprot:m.233422 g.233422  ORF g.233422 m.233422 type:complete len:647 (+) comp26090_c1_seq1:67-2007(+)
MTKLNQKREIPDLHNQFVPHESYIVCVCGTMRVVGGVGDGGVAGPATSTGTTIVHPPLRPPQHSLLPALHPRLQSAATRKQPHSAHPHHGGFGSLPFQPRMLSPRLPDDTAVARMSALQRTAHLIRSGGTYNTYAVQRPSTQAGVLTGPSLPGTAPRPGTSGGFGRSGGRFPPVPRPPLMTPSVSRKKRASLVGLMLGHGSGAESGGNGEIEYLSLTGTALSSIITLAKEQSGGDADDGHAAVDVAADSDDGSESDFSEDDDDVDAHVDYEDVVSSGLEGLRRDGVHVIDAAELDFGDAVDSGAFGVVHRAVWRQLGGAVMKVAVKTSERDDAFDEVWDMFALEARMAWQASAQQREGVLSHICKMYGVAVSGVSDAVAGGPRPKVHMVMELLDCSGDIHDVIHDSRQWVQVRHNGLDTGAKLRKGLVMHDGNDVYMYTMNRQLKVEISLGLVRGMKELRGAKVLHCDIKPANAVLHTVSGKHAEYRLGKVVKLIDFGEANILPHAKGDVAGTAGYMAPEMEEEGDAAHESDMYSCGVTLLELWCGCIGPTFDEYAGLSYGTAAICGRRAFRKVRAEIISALSRLDKIEPEVAAMIRRCVATNPTRRPLPATLIRLFKRLARSTAHVTTNTRGSKRMIRRLSSVRK